MLAFCEGCEDARASSFGAKTRRSEIGDRTTDIGRSRLGYLCVTIKIELDGLPLSLSNGAPLLK